MLQVRRALISVSDKSGLVLFAKILKKMGVEIISTGGTRELLKKNGIPTRSITDVTGFPEILDGRVKTLHPNIYGGLLYLRGNREHCKTIQMHGIEPIDMVVVNLYPFQETIQKPNVRHAEAIENIDIGGPSMIRAAAKNYTNVAVVCDPADYELLAQELSKTKGRLSETMLEQLAVKAFQHTALYDHGISQYFRRKFSKDESLPGVLHLAYRRVMDLRYGENPHQRAALYQRLDGKSELSFCQLHGKELSYNNIVDLEAAAYVIREFRESAVCVIKHCNPCGIAVDNNLKAAIEKAIDCDPLSSFGGIVGFNRALTKPAAEQLLAKLPFFEVVVAPEFASDALDALKQRKNLRIIKISDFHPTGTYELKFMKSGILLQDRDEPIDLRLASIKKHLKVVTKAKPTKRDWDELLFAWQCAKLVWSNAIVLVRGKQTVGIGGGQPSRVDSVRIACEKAGERARGSYLASDGFFPMADNIDVAYRYGIRAVIQPGGSIRDPEVIDACNRYGMSMVFTGERHFRH